MRNQLFVAAMALAAFTACSEANLADVNPGADELMFQNQPMNSAVLTDANGNEVTSLSADLGTYYLNIKTKDNWYIESPNMEFTPTKMYGCGSKRVPVLVGNNWAQSRQLT